MMAMSERGTLASEGGGAIYLVAKVTLFPLTETKRKRIIFPGGHNELIGSTTFASTIAPAITIRHCAPELSR